MHFLFAPLLVAALAAQNLIVNGSFEEGRDPGRYRALYSGASDIRGWHLTRGPVDYIGSFWAAPDGSRSIDLDGTPGPGGIAQTFTTTPGAMYEVGFEMAGNVDGPPRMKRMVVSAAGQSAVYTFDISGHTHTSMGWTHNVFRFRANAASTTLEFYSLSPRGNWNGPALDNVTVLPASGGSPTNAPVHTMVPRPTPTAPPPTAAPASTTDLSGTWYANYPPHPVHVRITQSGTAVRAIMADSNGYVPAGRLTWYGQNTGPQFPVKIVCSKPNFVGAVWHPATVWIKSADAFDLYIHDCSTNGIHFVRLK